jgi:hypothetical protein
VTVSSCFRRRSTASRDGKLAYEDARFNALAQDGYDKLTAAIKAVRSN